MTEQQIRTLIREMLSQEMAPILMSAIEKNASSQYSSVRRYPNEAPVPKLRNIQPYGFASRAPAGTPALIVPTDHNATHLNIVGHQDGSRPELADGEAILYGADGQVVFMKSGGSIHQGSKEASEPVVLGNVLIEFLTKLVAAFTDPTAVGVDSLGGPAQLDPTIKQSLKDYAAKYLVAPATNIVGKKNFVERGG